MNLMDLASRASGGHWRVDATAPGPARAGSRSSRRRRPSPGALSRVLAVPASGCPPPRWPCGRATTRAASIGLGLVREGRVGVSLGTSDTIFGLMRDAARRHRRHRPRVRRRPPATSWASRCSATGRWRASASAIAIRPDVGRLLARARDVGARQRRRADAAVVRARDHAHRCRARGPAPRPRRARRSRQRACGGRGPDDGAGAALALDGRRGRRRCTRPAAPRPTTPSCR